MGLIMESTQECYLCHGSSNHLPWMGHSQRNLVHSISWVLFFRQQRNVLDSARNNRESILQCPFHIYLNGEVYLDGCSFTTLWLLLLLLTSQTMVCIGGPSVDFPKLLIGFSDAKGHQSHPAVLERPQGLYNSVQRAIKSQGLNLRPQGIVIVISSPFTCLLN